MRNLALPRIQQMKPYSQPLYGRTDFGGLLPDFNERTEMPKSVNRGLEKLARSQKSRTTQKVLRALVD